MKVLERRDGPQPWKAKITCLKCTSLLEVQEEDLISVLINTGNVRCPVCEFVQPVGLPSSVAKRQREKIRSR